MWLDSSEKIHAPEIGGRWINSHSISLRELQGRVVLVDFWDYTCVNCIRTLPYVQDWDRRYHPFGLAVLGVHTPEFHFASVGEYVERAVRKFGIKYPVVLDNEYQIWQAYANRCWPAKYMIDHKGYVRYYHFGEGSYKETEEAIRKLLLEADPEASLPRPASSLQNTSPPGARCLPITPELYLGFERGRLGNEPGYTPNEVSDYRIGSEYAPGLAYLEGPWFAGREAIAACPLEGRPSRLLVSCRAAEVNLVMSPPENGEATLSILVDGKSVARSDAGADVSYAGGSSVVRVCEPRMYCLVETTEVRPRLIELSAPTPGVEAFAFTFVSCTNGGATDRHQERNGSELSER